MKTIGMILLAVISFCSMLIPQSYEMNKAIFSPEEILVYKVKWSFIRLGTITIKTSSVPGNPDAVLISMTVRSEPALFFIDVDEFNETLIDKRTCTSLRYFGDHRDGKNHTYIRTSYDPEEKVSVYSITGTEKSVKTDSGEIYNCPRYVDGPSLFFFTRAFARSKVSLNVPTMVNGKIENTKLIFTEKKELLEIDAFPHQVSAIKYFGSAGWEGGTSQGLSGDFFGYVTDDDASIPVYAEVSVLLGSLKIELERFHRPHYKYNTGKVSNK